MTKNRGGSELNSVTAKEKEEEKKLTEQGAVDPDAPAGGGTENGHRIEEIWGEAFLHYGKTNSLNGQVKAFYKPKHQREKAKEMVKRTKEQMRKMQNVRWIKKRSPLHDLYIQIRRKYLEESNRAHPPSNCDPTGPELSKSEEEDIVTAEELMSPSNCADVSFQLLPSSEGDTTAELSVAEEEDIVTAKELMSPASNDDSTAELTDEDDQWNNLGDQYLFVLITILVPLAFLQGCLLFIYIDKP